MTLESINLDLSEVFSDPERRQAFFRSIAQDDVASAIRGLRKLRSLTQNQLAEKTQMKQSAISRIEQAEHAAWNLVTLFRVADALDARWLISLQPVEEAIDEIMTAEKAAVPATAFVEFPNDSQSGSAPVCNISALTSNGSGLSQLTVP